MAATSVDVRALEYNLYSSSAPYQNLSESDADLPMRLDVYLLLAALLAVKVKEDATPFTQTVAVVPEIVKQVWVHTPVLAVAPVTALDHAPAGEIVNESLKTPKFKSLDVVPIPKNRNCPVGVVSKSTILFHPLVTKGEMKNHAHIEKSDPAVNEGMVIYCEATGLKNTLFERPVGPATCAVGTELDVVSDPVFPVTSPKTLPLLKG
jgi:hypothetical protein